MGSVEVVGAEDLLAAANSTGNQGGGGEHADEAVGADGLQRQQPQLQQLARAARSTAEVAPGLSRCNPDFEACSSQTKSNCLCWQLQVGPQRSSTAAVRGKASPASYGVCRVPLVCSCPFCSVKWREEDFIFCYKAMKSSFSGKNTANLPAVCRSLVRCSSKLLALRQYLCNPCRTSGVPTSSGLPEGRDEAYTCRGKWYHIFPTLL